MTNAPRRPEPAEERGFEVALSCPHCGAPFAASDETVSHTCAHCRSLLLVEAPARDEIFVEPAQVTTEAGILETLLRYRVDAQRAALIAQFTREDGQKPAEFVIAGPLARFETALRKSARILECRPLHVPYRHTAGKIVQAVLGRHGDGAKIARLRAYVAEQTAPAYDAARFNLRDTGLRMGRSVFRPLRSADVAKLGAFVPIAPEGASASRRGLEKWRGQNLEPGFDPVAKEGRVAVSFEATVYRPYFLVRALLDRGEERLLFDGGFDAIAGYLGAAEYARLSGGGDADPLRTSDAAFRQVHVIPARCPNCGMDPRLVDDAVVSICANCHAGIAAAGRELTLRNYEREDGATSAAGVAWLPFWRFPFALTLAGPSPRTSPPLRALDAWARVAFPQGLPKGFAPQGDGILVPAWRLLATEAGDEAFAEIARALHGRAWNWTPDRVGLDARPRFVPASLPEPEARDLAWASLFALHTKPAAARLNTLVLKRVLFDATLTPDPGVLTLVPFTETDKAYARPEVSVPRLLVNGGAVLAAQRMTVQAAASAYAAAQNRPSAASRARTAQNGPFPE